MPLLYLYCYFISNNILNWHKIVTCLALYVKSLKSSTNHYNSNPRKSWAFCPVIILLIFLTIFNVRHHHRLMCVFVCYLLLSLNKDCILSFSRSCIKRCPFVWSCVNKHLIPFYSTVKMHLLYVIIQLVSQGD